jgi:hypothetical protein
MSDQAYLIKEKLAALETALLEQLPTMRTLLQDIHRSIRLDPDLVTLLSEEDCAIVVQGLMKQTGAVIATSALKAPKKKALSRMTVADL